MENSSNNLSGIDVLTVVTWDGSTGFSLDSFELEVLVDDADETALNVAYSAWMLQYSTCQDSLPDVHFEVCREGYQGSRQMQSKMLYIGSPWAMKNDFVRLTANELFKEDNDGVFFLKDNIEEE